MVFYHVRYFFVKKICILEKTMYINSKDFYTSTRQKDKMNTMTWLFFAILSGLATLTMFAIGAVFIGARKYMDGIFFYLSALLVYCVMLECGHNFFVGYDRDKDVRRHEELMIQIKARSEHERRYLFQEQLEDKTDDQKEVKETILI